jgi:hypothetical protein
MRGVQWLPTCLCNNQGDKIPHVSKTPLQRPVKKIWGQKRKKKTKKKKQTRAGAVAQL